MARAVWRVGFTQKSGIQSESELEAYGPGLCGYFYSHRYDPETPLEETMMALDHIVRSGKALYVGICSYSAEQTRQAAEILKGLGTPLLIHQPKYSLLDRWIEDGLQDVLDEYGTGSIAFCPLAQGVLTNKYLNGIPEDSRAKGPSVFLNENNISPETLRKVRALNQIAAARGDFWPNFHSHGCCVMAG